MGISVQGKIYSTKHMSCGVTIAKLEAQVAEYLAFMDRFRAALQREEHGSQQ
jgi:hypothetical protein